MRLLIVDDSKVSRLMLRAIVEDNLPDTQIFEASDGVEALDQLSQNDAIDMAIVDYNMPGMNGLELWQKIKDQVPHGALLTANIQPHIRAEAESLGATFLNKPVSEETVKPFITSSL